MTGAVVALVGAGLVVAAGLGAAWGLDAAAVAILVALGVVGALAVIAARRARLGMVAPRRCHECEGLNSASATHCIHCGAPLP